MIGKDQYSTETYNVPPVRPHVCFVNCDIYCHVILPCDILILKIVIFLIDFNMF